MFRIFRQWVALVVSLSFLTATPVPLFASTGSSDSAEIDWNLKAMQDYDPLFKEFMDSPWAPPKTEPFDAKDPVVDQDPYFMRSESYTAPFTNEQRDETAFNQTNGAIEIQLPGANRALKIAQPLAPLFEEENFLVLQSTDQKMFSDKGVEDEGLFFIDKRYLQTELAKKDDLRPVPVFFLPLTGKGWTERIHTVSVEPFTVIAMRNAQGGSVTIDIQMIYQMAQALHNNVVLATLMALKHEPELLEQMRRRFINKAGGQIEFPYVELPRGSTAAFGTFFIGVNLDDPSKGILPVAGQSSWNFDILPKAYGSLGLTPDAIERLIHIGYMTGTVYILGVIAQYTMLRDRMLERRAYIEQKEDEAADAAGKPRKNRTTLRFKAVREFKETIDVFSHGLATLAGGIGTTTGFTLEYTADRMLGDTGSSPNGWIRWALNKTYLYGRKQNERIAANWASFYLGVLILGGVDTVSVVLQLLFVSPIFFPAVASLFGPHIHHRIENQFSGAHAENNNVVTSEVLRNLTGYFVSGSYSYSSSQRQALMEIVRPVVEGQMRLENKNPDDPKNATELEKRIEARLELMLVERGLPSNAEFLFSGPSVFRGMMHMLGYKVDREKLVKSLDYIAARDKKFKSEDEKREYQQQTLWYHKLSNQFDRVLETAAQYPENAVEYAVVKKNAEKFKRKALSRIEGDAADENFVLEKARWGLLSHALKNAYAHVAELAEQEPNDPKLAAARDMLAETRDKYHALMGLLKHPLHPIQVLKNARQVRKELTLLSYEGPVIGAVKYLDVWEKAKEQPEAAAIAARYFRQALFSKINGKDLISPTEKDVLKFGAVARQEAEQTLAAAPPAAGFTETDIEIETLEIIKLKAQEAEAEKRAKEWRPDKPDLLERWQRAKSEREALAAVQAQVGEPVTLNQETLEKKPEILPIYKEEYRKALSRRVSLFPDEATAEGQALVQRASDLAESEIQQNMENNRGWMSYHAQLDPVNQVRFLTHEYADAFLAKYVESTVSNSNHVGLTSPSQPGWFQRLRQKALPRKDSFLGKTVRTILRAAESPMDATAYRPGFKNWRYRNLPWWRDWSTDIQLTFRFMWTGMTIGYLQQYYIWQVKFDWPTAFFFLWTSGITSVVHYWIDRLMMNMGVRPMHDTWSKVKYSILYTWLTYPSYIPFFFFYEDFNRFWMRYVAMPIGNVLGPVITSCERLLTHMF